MGDNEKRFWNRRQRAPSPVASNPLPSSSPAPPELGDGHPISYWATNVVGRTGRLAFASPENYSDLLRKWAAKARKLRDGHYVAASRLQKFHYLAGVPAVALSTIVGTAVFASLGDSVSMVARVIVGGTSVLAAVLSGLVTFMRFAERAEEHRKCAAGFESIVREIDACLVDDPPSKESVDQIRRRLDELGFGLVLPENA